jgi:hypothetical protein
MFDSTTPAAIPAGSLVAGYVDGAYAWKPREWARFPLNDQLAITVVGQAGARIADVETGDLGPGSGALWAKRELIAGRRPTLYSNLSTWEAVVWALKSLGADPSMVDWWAADPTGSPHLVPGSVATQYAWPGRGSWGHFDVSVTNGTWPDTLHPVTVAGPPPKPPMVAVVSQPGVDTGYWLVAADGGVFAEGTAPFLGSMGGYPLTAPIVAASATTDGKGYRLVGSDGAVYAFGTALYEGGRN